MFEIFNTSLLVTLLYHLFNKNGQKKANRTRFGPLHKVTYDNSRFNFLNPVRLAIYILNYIERKIKCFFYFLSKNTQKMNIFRKLLQVYETNAINSLTSFDTPRIFEYSYNLSKFLFLLFKYSLTTRLTSRKSNLFLDLIISIIHLSVS